MALRTSLRHADGIILGPPEYHGSVSGVLINALDWMGKDELDHAWVVPEQASVPQAWRVFPSSTEPSDEGLNARLEAVGRATARTALMVRAGARDAMLN